MSAMDHWTKLFVARIDTALMDEANWLANTTGVDS
jgi:hypothetical protein